MSSNKRIFYFDALRALAILCVVLLHVTGHLGEIMNYNVHTIFSLSGIFETFANNFFRIGVPLFLMLSGALLLGRDWDVKGFFKKRIPRIAIPFVFWSLVFTIMLVLASYFISSVNFVTQFGIGNILQVFVDTLICKAPGSAVYWFFWMMLGMYILMPLFNRWINNTDLKNVEAFLVIWTLYIVLTHSLMLPIPEYVSFFISPIGFVVLGYYLRHSEREIFNSPIAAAILIIIPSVFMLVYSYAVVDSNILFVFHRYSLPVMMLAIGTFCLFKSSSHLKGISDLPKNIISSIALCSYGMYLIHSQIIMVVRKILHISFGFIGDYVILFAVGFVLSWIIIYVLSKIPVLEELIGVK